MANVVTGGTCASDEPGEHLNVFSVKRASMSKKGYLQREERKGQIQISSKRGAAKPTYVSTDKKKKKKKMKKNLSHYHFNLKFHKMMESLN